MKLLKLSSILFSAALLSGSVFVSVAQAQGLMEGRCRSAVGEWAWDTRRFPVEIKPDGSVVALDQDEFISARWTCLDADLGVIRVTWSTGFNDAGRISADGNTLHLDNGGGRFNAIRR